MNTTPETGLRLFELKVTLCDTEPPVWRRVRVPGDCTLDRLHRVLQVLMGWHDMHLHDFRIAGRFYGRPVDADTDADLLDERGCRLDRLVKKGARILYRYDFGDDWRLDIRVERIVAAGAGIAPVECLDGGRAAPPEDCGGPPGYDILLRVLDTPSHPQHGELRRRFADHDPGRFDRDAVNRALRAVS